MLPLAAADIWAVLYAQINKIKRHLDLWASPSCRKFRMFCLCQRPALRCFCSVDLPNLSSLLHLGHLTIESQRRHAKHLIQVLWVNQNDPPALILSNKLHLVPNISWNESAWSIQDQEWSNSVSDTTKTKVAYQNYAKNRTGAASIYGWVCPVRP